jgi:futalosine hydrolase
MNLLIVAATEGEIRPLPTSPKPRPTDRRSGGERSYNVDTLITGVGMVATTYALTKHLQHNRYDLALQIGVAGSFDRDLVLGQVVFVHSDRFGDLGAEDHDNYLDIFQMGLLKNGTPFTDGWLNTPILPVHEKISLPKVTGLTVNTVSGNDCTIKNRSDKYGAATESMEGAAFHYVCLQENVPFAQVRAISNYVTPRDKSQWKMKEAITNLNNWLIEFVDAL